MNSLSKVNAAARLNVRPLRHFQQSFYYERDVHCFVITKSGHGTATIPLRGNHAQVA
jgi:hypothetical protein